MTQGTAPRGYVDHWITPRWVIDALGPFNVDPCCCAEMLWPTASEMIAPPRDGLLEPWGGAVWLNPPFRHRVERWMDRMAMHANGVALVAARVETRWWHASVWGASSAHTVLFPKGRIAFHTPRGELRGEVGFPVALIGYGAAGLRLRTQTQIPGVLLHGWTRRSGRRRSMRAPSAPEVSR